MDLGQLIYLILGAMLAQNIPILILTLRLYSRMSRLEAQNEILLCRAGFNRRADDHKPLISD